MWTGEALDIRVFVLLGDGMGRFGAPGPAVSVVAPLVPHGPGGVGLWMADVTGDGLDDVVTQDAAGATDAPTLNLFVSESATKLAPATKLEGLGFDFADVDGDGQTDIVTTRAQRLTALLGRGASFEPLDLGVSTSPPVKDYVIGADDSGAARLHVLYDLSACARCSDDCADHCRFGVCIACLADGDCAGGRCVDRACVD